MTLLQKWVPDEVLECRPDTDADADTDRCEGEPSGVKLAE
jgi:hypothetical protein